MSLLIRYVDPRRRRSHFSLFVTGACGSDKRGFCGGDICRDAQGEICRNWIELWNLGEEAIHLEGFGVSGCIEEPIR